MTQGVKLPHREKGSTISKGKFFMDVPFSFKENVWEVFTRLIFSFLNKRLEKEKRGRVPVNE